MSIAESRPWASRVERGICIHGGETCYLCEDALHSHERVVYYYDARFWEQGFFYHGECWTAADLLAKDFGEDSVREGAAIVLPQVRCGLCGRELEPGHVVTRVRGVEPLRGEQGGYVALPRVFHAACFQAAQP